MAPISPVSLKRSASPSNDGVDEHTNNKIKTDEITRPSTPEFKNGSVKEDLYDERPRLLLRRSVALALEHVGFDGAAPEAIEAICSEADVCASKNG